MDIVAKYKKDAVLMFVHENLVLTHVLAFGLLGGSLRWQGLKIALLK